MAVQILSSPIADFDPVPAVYFRTEVDKEEGSEDPPVQIGEESDFMDKMLLSKKNIILVIMDQTRVYLFLIIMNKTTIVVYTTIFVLFSSEGPSG